jgi:hypothetical protein
MPSSPGPEAQFPDPQLSGPGHAPARSRVKRAFDAAFSLHMAPIALLLMFPVMMTVALNRNLKLVTDPDIWWHMADARQMFAEHHFVRTETTSFTVAGQPWVNPEWLSEVPYWLGYRIFALRGLYVVTWLVLSANLLLFYWRGYLRSRHPGAALLASALGLVLMTVNAGPRTIAIAYLAMAAELMILEAAERGKAWLLWLLPLVFCVWVNLHGSWLIGIGLFVLYILCGSFSVHKGVFDQQGFSRAYRHRLLLALGLSIAALYANPYGSRLVSNPFDMMLHQKLNIANVQEWKPLDLSSPAGLTAFAAICFLVVASGLKGRKWRVYDIAFVFFAWYAAFAHMRFLFLAAVLTVPIFAQEIHRTFDLRSDAKSVPAKNAIVVLAAACVIAFLFPSKRALETRVAQSFPLNSIAAVQPSWRTLNSSHIGGRMAFDFKPTFIDSRYDIFEHRGVMLDYLKAISSIDTLEILDRYRIDHVLIPEPSPLAYLLQHTPGWQVIGSEKLPIGQYVMFARASGASAHPNP